MAASCHISPHATTYVERWSRVAKIGKVVEVRRGARVGYRIDFGLVDQARIRLGSTPGPDGKLIAFASRDQAQRVLDGIRAVMAYEGVPLLQAIARARPPASSTFDRHLDAYLVHFRALVETGKRSPTTLRE